MDMEKYSLTSPQKSIWLTEQYFKGTNINNVCGTFITKEKIDFKLLNKSINKFIQANDSFKIKLIEEDGEVKQYFDTIPFINFEIIDIKNEKEQEELEKKVAAYVFELIDNFLFKFVLFRYPDGKGGFVINTHHIISDSWTAGLMANKIAEIYYCFINNKDIESNSELSYKSYILSYEEYIQSDKFNKDKEYWKKEFETVPEVATIPSSKNNKIESTDANRILIDINEENLNQIKEECKELNVSLYNFFMAIFSIYLGRVSNLEEFVIGTPILNRTNYKEKHTTGMFINTLPFKINFNQELSFHKFISNISKTSIGLLRHQKYSYQFIIENLRKKDPSIPGLYNMIFSYQITKMNENLDMLQHETTWTFNENIADDIDIHIFEWNEDNSLKIAYDYKTNKYDEEDIKDIHNRIIHIIHQVIKDNKIILKDIEIITPEEKHKILYEFNNTEVDYPKDKTIVDLFEEQVKENPNNIAVVFDNAKLTYRELNEKANQFCKLLIDKNINPEDKVCILMEHSLETIITILGILKLGATYIPIDINYPINRMQFIIANSKASMIITNKEEFKNLDDKIETLIFNIKKLNIKINKNINNSKRENIAYIIYTSGSTGIPKGVKVKNNSLLNYIYWCKKYYAQNKHINFPLYTSLAFDLTVTSIFTPLITGGSVVIYNSNDIYKNLEKIFFENKVDIIKLTPAHLALINELNLENTKVKKMIIGGDLLSQEICKRISEKIDGIKIYNEYGPTEATVGCMIYCYSTEDYKYKSVPIGKPIDNVNIYIFDKNLNLIPYGCNGELFIGGECLAEGYTDIDKTKERFIINPYTNKIIYRTGDIAVFNEKDCIEYTGRADFQVKINGFRIEKGEITKNILEIDKIRDCYVDIVEKNNKKILCAYFVSEEMLDTHNLKKQLNKKIPEYMIPKIWIQIKEIPLTGNGKVDRKKLLELDINLSEKTKIYARNKTDENLLNELEKILNNKLGKNIKQNLFEEGLDSLSAIKLSIIISNKYDIQISIKEIFENPTVMELSDIINSKKSNKPLNIINKKETKELYTVTSAQKRIYYTSKLKENSLLYNISGGIIFDKEINVKLLEECLKKLINRHSSLRTYFTTKDGELYQKIEDEVKFNLEIDNRIYKKELVNKIYYDFIKPFDLERAPLIRTKIITLENNQNIFLLNMHHIISDGISLEILIKELNKLYNEEELSDKNLDYKDFAEWEKEQKETEEFSNAREFWIREFSEEIPLLNMPTTYARPNNQTFEGKSYNCKLEKEVAEKIKEAAKKLNITPFMLMLSAYYIVLSKYTSQDDIVVGTPTSGRELPELENIIGMFVNTLAIRNKVESNISFREFSFSIKEKLLECLKNQQYPFDMLVKDLNIKRDISRNPIFDTMFTYQNNGYPKINFQEIEAKYYIPDNNISKFDLSLEVVPTDNEYNLRFEYCTKLFDEKFIKRFSSHYINILNEVLEDNEIKISEIDMLSKEEKNKVLYEFNKTQLAYQKQKDVVDLFEEQVRNNPRNIAVEFENEKITYKELNERANSIAKNLVKNGIKKGDIIGVCLKRNIELIISIWGILKVGAVYMPIYTGYPIDRIRYMLKDSNAKLLITNSAINPNVSNIEKLFIDDYKKIKRIHKAVKNNKNSQKDLLYVIYTSGSTGRPKGVKITHKNLINFIYSFKNYYKEINNKDTFLASTNISFDVSIWELFLPILSGAKLVLHSEEIIKDIKVYCEKIIKEKITGLYIPPNILDLVYDILSKNIEDVKINKLLIGVEPIKSGTINKYFNINKEMCIINGYGPTETTICATALNYKKNINDNEIIPIGKPLKNNQIYIVSKDLKLQPIGIPGEIIVAGDGVGEGYINNEEQNLRNFIIYNNKRAYKTGDLAKWTDEGVIKFIGRNDEQVKISGYRIELKEISSILEKYPNINKVYTTTYKCGEENKIISYFMADINLPISDLKSYMQTKLPFYMIPKQIMQIQKFPTTINGKIDKNKLPIPQEKNVKEYVEPRNNFEKKVQKIWKKLLHIERIGINDNVFDLGCDSLIAIKFQTEAMNQNLDINYGDIFACPTIKLLSERKNKKIEYKGEQYNYTEIHKLIEKNKYANLDKIKKIKNKNILLFGATGFLGAHILDNYLSTIRNSKIYCIIRSKDLKNPEERLKKILNFYFDKKYDSYFGKRIIVVRGDITKKNFDIPIEELEKLIDNIDVVINSAAIVKHYGQYENFDLINVKGTKNVADYCKKNNKKLYHISTTSVSGIGTPTEIEILEKDRKIFDETSFYIGQKTDNVYIKSKFEAEKLIFEEILRGLDATILRVGNLTNRYSDGNFQINVSENAFLNRVIAIIKLGAIQKSFLEHSLEFTPIDSCAEAITKIINTKHNFSILHLSNTNLIKYEDLIKYIKLNGYKLEVISNKQFADKIKEILKSEEQRNSISGIITDLNEDKILNYVSEVITKSEITNKFLNKIKFMWPKINEKYIKKYINYLNKIKVL